MARKKARPQAPPETPSAPPPSDDSRIIWPISLAGVREAWPTVITPVQLFLRSNRVAGKSAAVSYMSTAGGIAESMVKKIDDSGLLKPAEDEGESELDPRVPRTNPHVLNLMRAVLEAMTKAGRTRWCPGHPDREGVVCFNCHAPSMWPGSPELLADDVREGQLKEWTTGALGCIVLILDCIQNGEPKNAAQWADSAMKATTKLVEGTKRQVNRPKYERQVRHQFCSLGMELAQEQTQDVGELLIKGGIKKMADVMNALGALALPIEARFMRSGDIHPNTMAALSLVLRPPKHITIAA